MTTPFPSIQNEAVSEPESGSKIDMEIDPAFDLKIDLEFDPVLELKIEPEFVASPEPAVIPDLAGTAVRHIVLFGDAMGDLQRVQQERGPGGLEGRLMPNDPDPWKLTLLSADRVVRRSITTEIPPDATHIVISIEGNRAIQSSGLLATAPGSYEEALSRLSYAADEFEREVRALIAAARTVALPTVICIMFPPHYDEPVHQRAAATALAIFNDRIIHRAADAQIGIVDLRGACTEPGDYANETQLSGAGMRKAARLIWRALQEASAHDPGARIYS